MKYVILIHSNPQPWGHPTIEFTEEGRSMNAADRERGNNDWEKMLKGISASGEFVGAEALGDPAESTIYRWDGDAPLTSEGPYAESREHLAGFFVIDVADRARAREIATQFSAPGDTIELRPLI